MASYVSIDTNWIIDVIENRDPASLRIWQLVQRGDIALFVPAICLSESIKHLEDVQQAWRHLSQRLLDHRGNLLRAALPASADQVVDDTRTLLANAEDQIEAALWHFLEHIGQYATIFNVSSETLSLTHDIRRNLGLSPADAMVLAMATQIKEEHGCAAFMSKDVKAFGTGDLTAFFSASGITYYSTPGGFLRSISDTA